MITTSRLLLHPLSHDQLLMYLRNDASLETALGVAQYPRTISPALQEAIEQTLLPNVADPAKNYLYCTLWTLISRHDHTLVGDLCICGEPDEAGEIIIGYGTYDAFQNKGYMTEAVAGMIQWAASEHGVRSIFADTEKDNLASSAVLVKNNFVQVGETETMFQWRLMLRPEGNGR